MGAGRHDKQARAKAYFRQQEQSEGAMVKMPGELGRKFLEALAGPHQGTLKQVCQKMGIGSLAKCHEIAAGHILTRDHHIGTIEMILSGLNGSQAAQHDERAVTPAVETRVLMLA